MRKLVWKERTGRRVRARAAAIRLLSLEFWNGRLSLPLSSWERVALGGPCPQGGSSDRGMDSSFSSGRLEGRAHFERLAIDFARHNAQWKINYSKQMPQTVFVGGDQPVCYLTARSIINEKEGKNHRQSTNECIIADSEIENDPLALPRLDPLHKSTLEIHIVFNETYYVPQLLIHGFEDNGTPWTANDARAYLEESTIVATPRALPAVISQVRLHSTRTQISPLSHKRST